MFLHSQDRGYERPAKNFRQIPLSNHEYKISVGFLQNRLVRLDKTTCPQIVKLKGGIYYIIEPINNLWIFSQTLEENYTKTTK